MGLAGYYARFIQDFSKIASRLMNLMKKDVKFVWTDKCKQSFLELKEKLTSGLVLTVPDGGEGLTLYTDACGIGLGAVLMQHGKVIINASRQPKLHEARYATLDFEFIPVVFAPKVLRHHFPGKIFKL